MIFMATSIPKTTSIPPIIMWNLYTLSPHRIFDLATKSRYTTKSLFKLAQTMKKMPTKTINPPHNKLILFPPICT